MKNRTKKNTYRPLSIYEQNVLLPILMKGLETKKGRANAVTSKNIIQGLRDHGLKITEQNVSKLINHIRTNDLIMGLMASHFGYYITNSEQEYINFENSLLGRESAIRNVRMSIKRQRRSMFSQIEERQLQLF